MYINYEMMRWKVVATTSSSLVFNLDLKQMLIVFAFSIMLVWTTTFVILKKNPEYCTKKVSLDQELYKPWLTQPLA